MIKIDKEKCIMCGACIDVCPGMVFEDSSGSMEAKYQKGCIKCYHCVGVCPVEAVTCDEFAPEEFRPVEGIDAEAKDVRNLILRKRSVREFKDKEVPKELLDKLMETAVHAPTGHNARTNHFTVITNRALIDRIDRKMTRNIGNLAKLLDIRVADAIVKHAAGREQHEMMVAYKEGLERYKKMGPPHDLRMFRGAPVLIIAHSGPDAVTGKDDSVIALTNLMLDAEANGLGSCWIGFLVGAAKMDPGIKKMIGVPSKHTVNQAIILGWPRWKYKRMIPYKMRNVKWID